MTISIERLRRLAEQKAATHAAMRAAFESVQAARRELRQSESDRDTHFQNAPKGLEPTGRTPFDGAIASAAERLRHAEAAHERLHDDWELCAHLARRGYEYARDNVAIPADLQEAFQ